MRSKHLGNGNRLQECKLCEKLWSARDRGWQSSLGARNLHPEARKLHAINLAVAQREVLEVGVAEAALQLVEPPHRRPTKRRRALTHSKAAKFLKSCLLCGRHGCCASKCDMRKGMAALQCEEDRLKAKDGLTAEEKRKLRLQIPHLK